MKLLSYYDIYRKRPTLKVLADKDVVQKLLWACQARKNGAIRIYNLFLTIAQALKFCASVDGTSFQDTQSWRLVSTTQKIYQKTVKQEQNASRILPPKFAILKAEDYDILKDRCMVFLSRIATLSEGDKRKNARKYMDHLILLTLTSVPTPRHQIFSLMEHRHLVWMEEETGYQIIFDGSNPPLKNGKAILLLLPSELSAHYKVPCF